MKLIPQEVHVIKTPTIDDLKLIETAGRTCYDSLDKITNDSYESFLKSIVKSGHMSVIEHSLCVVKFITSRAMMAELTRHRLCGFSIRSQRYTDESDLKIIKPFAFDAMDELTQRLFVVQYLQAEIVYQKLIENNVSKQIARGVLPEDTATIIYMSCNLRELFHIIHLRTSKGAHPQMRALIDGLKIQLPSFIQKLYSFSCNSNY